MRRLGMIGLKVLRTMTKDSVRFRRDTFCRRDLQLWCGSSASTRHGVLQQLGVLIDDAPLVLKASL